MTISLPIMVRPDCRLRSWQLDDAEALARAADNASVSINMRDRFPFPYTYSDACAFLRLALTPSPDIHVAIEVDGLVAGGAGLVQGTDVERCSAEIGYWLGEPWWGRGIATDVVRTIVPLAIRGLRLTRVFAVTFEPNRASARVLDKAGFRLEGRMRRAAIKRDRVLDELVWGITDGDLAAREAGVAGASGSPRR